MTNDQILVVLIVFAVIFVVLNGIVFIIGVFLIYYKSSRIIELDEHIEEYHRLLDEITENARLVEEWIECKGKIVGIVKNKKNIIKR